MNRLILFFCIMLTFITHIAKSQPYNGVQGQDATSLPISGGLIYLIAGAILLGVKKITNGKKK